MTFEIQARSNTRSCSYTRKSILAALASLGLTAEQRGTILYVTVPAELVARLEHTLQLVDRCVYYRKVNT